MEKAVFRNQRKGFPCTLSCSSLPRSVGKPTAFAQNGDFVPPERQIMTVKKILPDTPPVLDYSFIFHSSLLSCPCPTLPQFKQ